MNVVSVQRVEAEAGSLILRAAASMPRKQLARATGLSERYIKSLRAGEHQPSWPALIALASHSPDLRAWLLRQLHAEADPIITADEEAAAVAAAIKAYRQRKGGAV